MNTRIMIGNHNNNNNTKQQRYTTEQTDEIEEIRESTTLPQLSLTDYSDEVIDDDSDDELPPLHERFHWNNDSDDEESPEEIERDRMRCNAQLKKKHKRHAIPTTNNGEKISFPGTTKKSPTIIIHLNHEKCDNPAININENSTTNTKHKINNVHFGDDIGKDPQEHSTRLFFQNVNGLEFSTTSHTLLATCIGIQDNQIEYDTTKQYSVIYKTCS